VDGLEIFLIFLSNYLIANEWTDLQDSIKNHLSQTAKIKDVFTNLTLSSSEFCGGGIHYFSNFMYIHIYISLTIRYYILLLLLFDLYIYIYIYIYIII